jgi:8-oxo-dGTP pyrophosphatase MutT (NUDIX family)
MSDSPRRRRRRRRRGRAGAARNALPQKSANGKAGPAKKRRLRFRREKSAGGIVTRVSDGRTLVLLIRDPYGHWGFPKGHLERGERSETAAIREVMEETGLRQVSSLGSIAAIEWKFRFRDKLIQKHCEFFLMESPSGETRPQKSEGITECRWVSPEDAHTMIDYENARSVLTRAQSMLSARVAASPEAPQRA